MPGLLFSLVVVCGVTLGGLILPTLVEGGD